MTTPPTDDQTRLAKELVCDYLATVVAGHDAEAARRFVAGDVVQHGADLADGIEPLVAGLRSDFAREEATGIPPGVGLEPVFVIAEADLVTVCLSMPQPEPEDPSRSYPYFDFTTYRVRQGVIAERWPSLNKIAPPRRLQTAVPAPIAPVGTGTDLAANKRLVLDFYRCVFDAHDAGAVRHFVSEDYRQHAPHLPGRRAGLEDFVRAVFPDGPVPTPPENLNPPVVVVAEGDLVVVAGLLPQPEPDGSGSYPYFVYDAYRVTAGLLVEHWSGVNKTALPRHPGPPPGDR